MAVFIPNLEPSTLYITISIPPAEFEYAPVEYHYPDSLPENFEPRGYEVACVGPDVREEFNWGVYWHRDMRDGTWYTLRRKYWYELEEDARVKGQLEAERASQNDDKDNENDDDNGGEEGGFKFPPPPLKLPPTVMSRFVFEAREVQESPRLVHGVVGLIRVLRMPDHIGGVGSESDLRDFLTWLTSSSYVLANRSLEWALMVFLRTRRRVYPYHCDELYSHDLRDMGFDPAKFVLEAVDFAYSNVWFAVGRQLPHPILESEQETGLPEEEEEKREKKRAADMEKELMRLMYGEDVGKGLIFHVDDDVSSIDGDGDGDGDNADENGDEDDDEDEDDSYSLPSNSDYMYQGRDNAEGKDDDVESTEYEGKEDEGGGSDEDENEDRDENGGEVDDEDDDEGENGDEDDDEDAWTDYSDYVEDEDDEWEDIEVWIEW